MGYRAVGWATLLLAVTGCTHRQLQRSTVSQAHTLTDLEYQQVLDNLATLAKNPGALPDFAVPVTGQVQVTDTGSTTDLVIPDYLAGAIWSGQYSIMASRAVQENWTVTPVTDPDKLNRMRCAYQIALGVPPGDCEACVEKLEDFFCHDACSKKKDPGGKGEVEKPADCDRCLECAVPRVGSTWAARRTSRSGLATSATPAGPMCGFCRRGWTA
jgi:hypothetical protein